jgi:hypothetical protein
MKNWKHFIFMAIIAIFGIIIGFTTCDNKTDDPVICTCPIGTLHLEDAPCCEGVNCDCIVVIITEGATIDGGSAAALQKITDAFDYMESWGDEYIPYAAYVKSTIKIMRIVPGASGVVSVVEENGKWVAVITDGALNYTGYLDMISGAFYFFAEEHM